MNARVLLAEPKGPADDKTLLMKISGVWTTRVISFGVVSGLFNTIGIRSTIDASALAEAHGFDVDVVERLLEGYVYLGLIAREAAGFTLTPDGTRLTSTAVDSLAPLAALWAGSFDRAWSMLPDVAQTGRSGFECAHDEGLFVYLGQRPDKARLFDEAMQGLVRTASVRAVDDIASDEPSILCDVGGGNGALLADAVRRLPATHGILFDQPDLIATARNMLSNPSIEQVGGDFFEKVPRAAAHILANILHDWSDEDAVRILASVAAAQPEDGAIYLLEPMLGGNEPVMARQFDLHMMMLTGGRERSRTQLAKLLAAVGYRVDRITPLGEIYSLMKATRSRLSGSEQPA